MSSAAPQSEKTSWPIKLYLGAVVFALLTLVIFTSALDGPELSAGRIRTQAGICLIFVLRLLWAIDQKEQSKIWRVYVTCLFLAAPIWMVLEPCLFAIKRAYGG